MKHFPLTTKTSKPLLLSLLFFCHIFSNEQLDYKENPDFSKRPFIISSQEMSEKKMSVDHCKNLFSSKDCKSKTTTKDQFKPWFTGTLVTPPPKITPLGHFDTETFLIYTSTYGIYNNHWKVDKIPTFHQFNPIFQTWLGLSETVDISLVLQGFYNHIKRQSGLVFGDFLFGFDYQIRDDDNDEENTWFPSVKLTAYGRFPTGKYEKLSPHKKGTDIGGLGTYWMFLGLTFSKQYEICYHHCLQTAVSILTSIPTSTKVKGLNVYGGDPSTHGTVFPGAIVTITANAEYNLNQNWVIAAEIISTATSKFRFEGHSDTDVGLPNSIQISFGPSIEYNFNDHMGAFVTGWFSVAGRNSGAFAGGSANFIWNF